MFSRNVLAVGFLLFFGITASARADNPDYVEWSTYLGGSGDDIAYAVGVDGDGHVYIAGSTDSEDFLASAGAGDVEIAGSSDAVVVKLDPEGARILAVATLGGPGPDGATDMWVADDGMVTIGGQVAAGFVPPEGGCQAEVQGDSDVFVARLDSDLRLLRCDLLGGEGSEGARDLDVSEDGVVTVLGFTTSPDLRTTDLAFQKEYGDGGNDLFLARMRLEPEIPCEDRVDYLTYLGGSARDAIPDGAPFAGALSTDATGLVTVAGHTDSDDFLGDQGSRIGNLGAFDLFLLQLRCDRGRPRDEQLVYGALIGGSDGEGANWVEVTPEGLIRVVGYTWSSADFPVTETVDFGGKNDAFILTVDPRTDAPEPIQFATYIGGPEADPPTVAVSRPDGSLLLGGTTQGDFPRTPNALADFYTLTKQAYLLDWEPRDGVPPQSRIRLSTPLTVGDNCAEWIHCSRVMDLAPEPGGTILACGVTSGILLPASLGSLQPGRAGGADMFVGGFDLPQVRYTWPFIRGDCNDDGALDISDGICILTWLFSGGPTPGSGCLPAADANSDDSADLSDAVYILNHLFLGGPAPGQPFPDCGSTPASDKLSCETEPASCR
jgi:hypothetical protein